MDRAKKEGRRQLGGKEDVEGRNERKRNDKIKKKGRAWKRRR